MMSKRLYGNAISTLVLLATVAIASAQSSLHNLDIRVVLSKNGDARITETRQMTVGSKGTECYIVIEDIGACDIKDLCVMDETGHQFEKSAYWDVDKSRDYKAGKCGIVEKSNGYELCWGIGAQGERTYTTSYTVTNLLKAYNECDGFNWMFVAEDLHPYPEHVLLTISAEDSTELTDSIANIWAFRYSGNVDFVNGNIVAESSEPFKQHDAMIVMAEFKKGVFCSLLNTGEDFEVVKQRAFEGSDYLSDGDEEMDKAPWWMEWLVWICGAGMGFLALCGLFWEPVERLCKKWKYCRNIEWYREIPLNGNLTKANDFLNSLQSKIYEYDNLLSACVVKLINQGALGIENHPNKDGKVVPAFVVKRWTVSDEMETDDQKLLRAIYTIFDRAAGDKVLEPWELKAFMNDEKNEYVVNALVDTLHQIRFVHLSEHREDVRQLLGLKKYLKDFTLLDERGMQEVTLWKDYMVWATLFGCASTVVKEMRKINPEYFKMDSIARQMSEGISIPDMHKTFVKAAGDAYHKQLVSRVSSNGSSRRSGGGGRSSRRGGGGHSGGGHGGGIR